MVQNGDDGLILRCDGNINQIKPFGQHLGQKSNGSELKNPVFSFQAIDHTNIENNVAVEENGSEIAPLRLCLVLSENVNLHGHWRCSLQLLEAYADWQVYLAPLPIQDQQGPQ